ncbi:MAG: hypothetical protein ACRD3R_02675 [Terriglobales bacterium]
MERALPDTLVVAAGRDALVSPALVETGARMLGAEFRRLEGLGHAIMLDARWERSAEALLAWIEERGL